MWQQTHNTYTQVSSETGVPGLLIYLGLIFSIFRGTRIQPWVKPSDPDIRVLRNVSFTLRLSLIAFCGGALFGSLAYGMHLPLLAGLAETLRRVMAAKRYKLPAPAPAWTPRKTQPLPWAAPRIKA